MGKKIYKRILIIEPNWVGDVLFSTPAIRAVREKFRNAYIACLVVPRVREILEDNRRIDEIIIYDEKASHKGVIGKMRLISRLRKKHFDLCILLHRSFTRALIAYLAGIKERAGYVTRKRRKILTIPVELPEDEPHKVEYFLRIAEELGCGISSRNYEFFVSDKEKKYLSEKLTEAGVGAGDFLVVINSGGNWAPKRWSEENFAKLSDALIRNYGVKVIATGGEKDTERVRRIKEKMSENLIAFAGKTSLKELAALLERADVVISGDSGPMHIAAAVKTNVIALFGPTSPRLTGPYGAGKYSVIQKEIDCEIPCYNLACDDYRCMGSISVDDVLEEFGKIYQEQKRQNAKSQNRGI